jgi:hypothetical protein
MIALGVRPKKISEMTEVIWLTSWIKIVAELAALLATLPAPFGLDPP